MAHLKLRLAAILIGYLGLAQSHLLLHINLLHWHSLSDCLHFKSQHVKWSLTERAHKLHGKLLQTVKADWEPHRALSFQVAAEAYHQSA